MKGQQAGDEGNCVSGDRFLEVKVGLASAHSVHCRLGKQHGAFHFYLAVYFDNKNAMLPFERAMKPFKDAVV